MERRFVVLRERIREDKEAVGRRLPNGDDGVPVVAADLIRRAKALNVVRDGWAGFYYHWYLNPAILTEVVNGLKAIGYQFVPVDGTTK